MIGILARRLGLGTALLHLYHRPLARMRRIVAEGGPWAMRETERQRQEMEAAANSLPALVTGDAATPYCFHILTGRRFWYQSAFCLTSLAQHAGAIRAQLYDDGSLEGSFVGGLKRLGGGVAIRHQAETIALLDREIPEHRFPVLRELWRSYPNIRKLTDVHIGSHGWKLVIDSDLLFFRRPDVLLRWLLAPTAPLHAVDALESYGYSRPLMERLAGAPIPPLVNVGLCGLRSDDLDWELIERWCGELIRRERLSYYLEQALVAMLVARAGRGTAAPASDYVTMPSRTEVRSPTAVMHHYVAQSKVGYFREAWCGVLRSLR
jgi:hypothetical protein